MIKKYKSLAIFKKDPTDDPKKPSHDVTASLQKPDGTYEKSVNVGSAWTKDGQKGKYLSVGLSKQREWEGKKFSGYVLVDEQELDKLVESLRIKTTNPDYPLSDPNVDTLDPNSIDF